MMLAKSIFYQSLSFISSCGTLDLLENESDTDDWWEKSISLVDLNTWLK
jgi:hypothetical protein